MSYYVMLCYTIALSLSSSVIVIAIVVTAICIATRQTRSVFARDVYTYGLRQGD